MGKVVFDITMPLDGFIAGPSDEIDPLHNWIFTGEAGDITHLTDSGAQILDEASRATGAIIAGRRTCNVAKGWGGSHPIPAPVFVLTHSAPKKVTKGSTAFTFVTDGIDNAVKQARAVAGDKDVVVMGGGIVASQCIKAGLIDEICIHLAPVLLGSGIRLFGDLGTEYVELESTGVIEDIGVTHLQFRVVK